MRTRVNPTYSAILLTEDVSDSVREVSFCHGPVMFVVSGWLKPVRAQVVLRNIRLGPYLSLAVPKPTQPESSVWVGLNPKFHPGFDYPFRDFLVVMTHGPFTFQINAVTEVLNYSMHLGPRMLWSRIVQFLLLSPTAFIDLNGALSFKIFKWW